ncbi:hypothetical protein ROHU_018691 [Labeo rohita]|uniref:Uncharacterized protein n=1 Tax=Labeo rohita TaxID=84645 RepID=A0A498NAT9_LABRO|nr:hypothetical protein ROHU_018691 [Labeo rohita]
MPAPLCKRRMEVRVPAAHSGLDLSTSAPPKRCPTMASGSNELAFCVDTSTANRCDWDWRRGENGKRALFVPSVSAR